MSRPYLLYLRFLVTKGCISLEDANACLKEVFLPAVDAFTWNREYKLVSDSLPEPVLRQIEKQRFEGPFLKWMKLLELDELWAYEKPFRSPESAHVKLVYDIHYDPKLRITLNALLLKAVSHKDCCQALNMRFACMLREDHIRLYEKYFWNPRLMLRKDWKNYLKLVDGNEKNILFTALTEPTDIVKALLELPSQVAVSDSLQFLLTSVMQKARHYLKLNTPDSNKEARAWIQQAMALTDKYDKYRSGDASDFGKSVQMSFDYIDTEFPTPDDVTMCEIREMDAAHRSKDKEQNAEDGGVSE